MPHFVTVNERLHHYAHHKGAGARAVVFANSLGTDMRIWDQVCANLPPEIPTLTYDKSGHGMTQGGAGSIAALAQDLAALMDQLNLRDALICGVSVGGQIAQALAFARPDLVAGLVLCNTGYKIGTADLWATRIATLKQDGLDAMAEGIIERWFSADFRRSHPEAIAGYRLMLTRTPQEGYAAVCGAIRDADLSNGTSQLTCPALCVAGGDDLATPPDVVEALAALIPNAQSTCYEGIGHLPCIEAPSRLATDIVAHYARLP